jgi:tetratricopeptide (TPR) repeat protein
MHREIEEYDDSVAALKRAIEKETEINGGEPNIECASMYKLIGEDLMKLEDIEDGINYIEKALEIE